LTIGQALQSDHLTNLAQSDGYVQDFRTDWGRGGYPPESPLSEAALSEFPKILDAPLEQS
jgi:hypothetical protein